MSSPWGSKPPLTNNNNKNTNTRPASSTQQTRNKRPQIQSKKNGLTITHREYINSIELANAQLELDVSGGSYLSRQPRRYSINPGDGNTFPWLAGIADRFEKYEFSMLKFSYKPSVAVTTRGGLAMTAVYDPADPLPTNRSQLYNAETGVRAAVYDPIDMPLKQTRLNGKRHVRSTHHGLVDAIELRTTDPGYVLVTVVNASEDVQFGDLFVEYTVTLIGPKIGGSTAKASRLRWDVAATHGAAEPFGFTDFNTLAVVPYDYGVHHDPQSTLKTVVQHVGASGYEVNSTPYNPTRVVFEEPFTGTLTLGHSGPAEGFIPIVNNSSLQSRPADAPRLAQVTPLHTIESGSPLQEGSHLYSVQANAGEVIDFAGLHGSNVSTDWTGTIGALFAEAAPYLIDGLFDLFAAL